MRDTKAPRPVARPTGRNGSTDSASILAPRSAHEVLFDLRPWAKARRYRMRLEASFAHESDPEARGDGRAYVEVPGRRGVLYPLGADTIGAWTSTRGVLAELLAADPAVRVHQRGDLEAVVRFPSSLLDAIALAIRPRRRRTLDPARARSIGAGTAFAGAQAPEDAPGRDGGGEDGSDIEVRA